MATRPVLWDDGLGVEALLPPSRLRISAILSPVSGPRRGEDADALLCSPIVSLACDWLSNFVCTRWLFGSDSVASL